MHEDEQRRPSGAEKCIACRRSAATVGGMSGETIRVHVSGYLEYRVDNPAALIDASKFTPQQLDPEGKSNLGSVDPRVWELLGTALVVEVSKGARFTEPPGASQVDSKIQYSLSPSS